MASYDWLSYTVDNADDEKVSGDNYDDRHIPLNKSIAYRWSSFEEVELWSLNVK